MPALPYVDHVAKIQIHATYGTDGNVVNGFHCKFGGTPTSADLSSWALLVGNSWESHIAQSVTLDYHINQVLITDLTSANGAVGESAGATGTGWAGTGQTLSGAAANVAGVVNYSITRRYRGGRPRQYICGISQTHIQNEDGWLPAFVTSFGSDYGSWMSAIEGYTSINLNPTAIVNVSYVQGHTWEQDQHGNYHRMPVYRTLPIVDTVNGYTLNPKFGTQRRRVQ